MQASARWHTAGRPVVYLAETPASALLEVFVHLETDEDHRPDRYQLLKIESKDGVAFETIQLAALSSKWKSDESETQALGDAWLSSGRTALFRVPSAITPETWNWVLNPRHAQAAQVLIVHIEKHLYDVRLFNS